MDIKINETDYLAGVNVADYQQLLTMYQAVQKERDELKAQLEQLREQLECMAQQHRCGCGHPACNRCYDDKQNAIVLEATPAQCLAEHKAQAGRDGVIYGLNYFGRLTDKVSDEIADVYFNQLRQQAKENK